VLLDERRLQQRRHHIGLEPRPGEHGRPDR
jgi:hypothetical protein